MNVVEKMQALADEWLPKDFTVAEYARRGFFEMCAIVAINLGLIVLAAGLCRKEQGRVPGPVKGLALFLCVFSLILVATALSKMVLYMGSFGLTRLRVLTSVFMVFLGLVVAAEAVKLFVSCCSPVMLQAPKASAQATKIRIFFILKEFMSFQFLSL